MLRLEELERRETPYSTIATTVGGVTYFRNDDGVVFDSYQAFENGASSVPVFVAIGEHNYHFGAGIGGGPRYLIIDKETHQVKTDVFIGDLNSRTGVSLDAFNNTNLDGVVVAHPTSPLEVSKADLDFVKRKLERVPVYALDNTTKVYVYNTNSGGVTSLPEFKDYKGIITGADGDLNRTYDQVYAAAFNSNAYVSPSAASGSANVFIHEWAHAFDFVLKITNKLEAKDVFSRRGGWASNPYYSGNITEWFAEGVTRHLVSPFGIVTLEEHAFFERALKGQV